MKYKFNNKQLDIPDSELDNLVDKLDISLADAIDIWLEDNDYKMCDEVKALEEKAKANRITATIHQAKADKPPTKRNVERKPDETKEGIIKALADLLETMADNVKIENIGKLITFELKGDTYKLDLIRQRKPKTK